MADKDLDALTADLKKAAVNTVALSVAQLAVKKVTDQLASTVGAFDKQVAKVVKDVEDLTSGMGAFNKEAAQAVGNAKGMTEAFGGLLGALTPLSAALKDVGDRLDGATISIRQSSTAINVHNQNLTQLQSVSITAAQGQGAVAEAMGKTETAADKSAEKLKKVHETAKELGGSMIDAFAALASGEEPMKVLTDKGGEMAKTMLKAKVDGVNLVETFKSLGVATGILEVTTAGATAAQTTQAAASGLTAIKTEAATAATLEQAAANRLFAGGALANVAGQTAMTAAAGEATIAFETQAAAATEAAAAESVALAPIGLILAGIAVAAAAVAGVFAIAANDISGKVGDLTKDMGLTEEQMGRVKDKSVSMGDVAKATFEVLGKRLNAVFGPGLKAIGDGFMSLYHTVSAVVVKAAAVAVGAFAGAFEAIRVSWSVLPAAMGDIIITGVNMVLDGVGKMVNGAIGLANGLIGTVNWLAKKLGLSLELPDLGQVQVTKLTNQFAGAAKAAGGAISGAFSKGFTGGFNSVVSIPGEIAGRAVEIAKDRIAEEAGKATDRIDQAGGGCACDSKAASNDTFREFDPDALKTVEQPIQAQKPQIENLKPLPKVDFALNAQIEALDEVIARYEKIGQLSTEVGKSLEAAFGKAGKAITGLFSGMNDLAKKLAEIDLQQKQAQKANPDKDDSAGFDARRFDARVQGYAAMSTAAKGFFEENSAGYKALEVAEIAFNTLHTLNTIKSMALETTSAAHTVTAQGAKQASYGVTAYAHALAELPFPFNLLAGAAVIAALVQVGVAIKGKPSGSGSVPGASDMKTRQDAQGSGSTLGDPKAKSESLEKALTHAQAYENKDLEYGNAMVRSLKSIDDQIGAVASALAKSFGAGGMLSTEGLALGKTGTAASLSNLGFGKSTTRTLQDQGLEFDATTFGAIAGGGGLSGSTYQQVLENTKKKAFGITTSHKSKVITETGALDPDFLTQVTGLIGLLGKGVGDAAKAIGSTDFEALLTNFKVDLGKLSFKDMTGTQIEEALNAIFGKLGDDMAKTAVPAIATFQKVGEGAFETLVRVARQYEVIDTTLKSVGMKFGEVGVASLAARERLVDLVGGIDNLTDQASFFAEHFLTEDERLKPVQKSVTDELVRLKLPADLTRQGFKDKVQGLDLSTQGDAELYAALMALAPAFDKVTTAAENAKAAVEEHDKAVKEKATSIQDRIDDLVMTPADKLAKSRSAEEDAVKALDASLLPLLKSLWAVEDAAQKAADAAQKEADEKALAAARSGALADLLDAQGYTEQAKKIRRDLSLAGVEDETQRDYMRRTWAAQDAAEKVSVARDVLTEAYHREQDAIQATKDKFQELGTSLRAFSASLATTAAGADLATRYRLARQTFQSTAALARLGDPDAMGRLQADGEAFTAASRDYVSTSQDYLHDVGLVRSAVDEAANTADRQVSIAQRQLDALDASVQGLIEIKAGVVSVEQAILSLKGALGEARAAGVVSVGGSSLGLGNPAPPATGSNNGGAANDPHKTLDGKFYYDQMLGQMAYTESLRDPAFYAANNIPFEVMIPGTQAYALLETYKVRNKDQYDYQEQLRHIQNYATGGSFEVGGSGPPDSKLFNLALSPGEAVNVQRADQKGDKALIQELRRLREELADLRQTSARIATSNDKMERTLTNVTEGGRAMQTQAAA